MTGAHEEVTYCSPSISSGKQKKDPTTSQPQFRSENTAATIETYQILLALQQLANNNFFENFQNNINRICKLPNSLTTTMPTFDGSSEKFELFEGLFQTNLKIHNQLTEDDRINYFHSLMRGDALQTFKFINGPTREKLGEILAVFRRKYVKPQSMATAKHNFQKLVCNPANQKLVDFLDELQKLAKDAVGIAAHAIIEGRHIVLWHDLLNDTITWHPKTKNLLQTVEQLVSTIGKLRNIYCLVTFPRRSVLYLQHSSQISQKLQYRRDNAHHVHPGILTKLRSLNTKCYTSQLDLNLPLSGLCYTTTPNSSESSE